MAIVIDANKGLHFNSKAPKQELNEYIAKQQSAVNEMAKYIYDLETKMDARAKELAAERISEKDMYVAKVEQACEDKVANLEVIKNALQGQVGDLNRKIAVLEANMVQRKSFFARIFSK